MTAEADLIAAIIASPDEPAAFLVYADFLQSRNDPRGELITLMHAGEQKLADKLLRANKAAFLGRLAKLESSIKLEAWRLGFVDHVRIVADDERHAAQMIDEVADHPSTRFMRTLEVKIIGKRKSYAGVDARLVELARPQTLSKIVLGDQPLSAALVESFPRVAAVPTQSWEEVVAAVSAARRAGPGFAHPKTSSTQRFVKSHRYRGTTCAIAVQPGRYEHPLVCMPRVLPPVVAFELARDLAAARQPDQ